MDKNIKGLKNLYIFIGILYILLLQINNVKCLVINFFIKKYAIL
jgi:hypothetical protein